ncbi:MAG: MlaE family lipid ABC transporter permease subunit [Bacteroidetes bacterium]|nr:MlaE family lipid ABC transporter permease subunit [Bacteroidota bacterium]MBU1678537.1 MlaE family lipid ABC transporter permease subunit [Bacteroidota bacterium]MBU2508250.1 MlaE family lipid ABC transporter permease subunit [Bacteroidota bacterium]
MKLETLKLPEVVHIENSSEIYKQASKLLRKRKPDSLKIDFFDVKKIDSIGVTLIKQIQQDAQKYKVKTTLVNLLEEVDNAFKLFGQVPPADVKKKRRRNFFEVIGEATYNAWVTISNFTILISDVFYWTLMSFFKKKLRREGEVIRQSVFIGVNALPIIALVSFLIGFILALQSSTQLRQFGANIFVADLVAIAMVTEMGPLITAIMVAGRSGSAITAEIATMTVTEEIDALYSMGIDPVPYLFVPKLIAIVITLPMLTTLANVIGIIGGAVIGVISLDLKWVTFFNEVIEVLRYKEILISLVKSFTFAVLIGILAIHFGKNVKGGSEGVGKSTTSSVVATIFFVIVADSILGLFFYF